MATVATKQTGPRDMNWWVNGSDPHLMRSALEQSICLAINKKAKTLAEISKQIDANTRYIEKAIWPLVNERLVTKTENGRYLANFVALDTGDWIELTRGIRENSVKLADAVVPHLPTLREAWERTSLPEQGFPWSEGIWPMLAVFVLNLAVPPHSSPSPEPPSRASGKRYWAGGREAVPEEYIIWGSGWDNTGTRDKRLSYGHLWSYGLARERPDLDAHTQLLFDAIAAGASSINAIVDRSGLSEERVREVSARAIEMGLVKRTGMRLPRRRGEAFALTFPVFRTEESDLLSPVVKEISSLLTSDILLPATADIADRLRALGYGHLEEQFGEWRRWLEGDVAGEALRELVKRGALPEPGNPAPMNFCMIGWMGSLPLMG